MKTLEGIEALKESGLNIFLSIKVSEIPDYIFKFQSDDLDKTLCLVGHGGKKLWESLPHPLSLSDHPIDKYTLDQIHRFAQDTLCDDIKILYPADTSEFFPLQRLSRFLNLSKPTPLGIDISSEFGLWFAFRAVFLTNSEVVTPLLPRSESPCDACFERPCLSTHVIMEGRTKCPVQSEHQYIPEQIQYHQDALSLFDV